MVPVPRPGRGPSLLGPLSGATLDHLGGPGFGLFGLENVHPPKPAELHA